MTRTQPSNNHDVRRPLGRRGFLRAAGLCVGLPALESLLPRGAVAAAPTTGALTPSGAPLRMAFMSIPNGVHQDHWFPQGDGEELQLNRTMAPLESLKQHIQVISGLDHENATAGPDGAGDHARANATLLTGMRARKTAGRDIQCGISIDQMAAQRFGRLTRFPSLELTCDSIRNTGSCDSGYACAYQYNLAWSSSTTPVTPEPNPRLAFERLFGAGSHGERTQNFLARQQSQRSILDFVLEDARKLSRTLGKNDNRTLDEYLTGMRDIEQRIESAERFEDLPDPAIDSPPGIPPDFGAHMDLMYDLIVLAFQTDSTRVATLLLAYDGSNRSFPDLGIAEGHHYLTHNLQKPEFSQHVADIDRFYIDHFARFLAKLAETPDVDGASLLDNSMIGYGGAIANGNRHTHANLPFILAGSAGGKYQTGRHLQVPSQPMSNLFVTMLNDYGVPTDSFGDSTGRVSGL